MAASETAAVLSKIAADLRAAVSEDDVDRDAIALAARRLDARAEWVGKGLD